jgi:hypothetical protein
VCDGGRQPESSSVWIDPRWKIISWAGWAERLFGPDTVVKIKQAAKIEWVGKERFLGQKKIVKKNLGCCSLNKKQTFELKIEEIRIKSSFEIFLKMTF